MSGKFEHYAREAQERKESALQAGYNGMIPHDLWRRLIPIAQEYGGKRMADMALLYSYIIAHVNGQTDNDRYMSAWASVPKIVEETGIGKNRVAPLADALVAVGMLKTAYDYTSNKREKLYYPQYYSALTDEEIHNNMAKWKREQDAKIT